VELEDFLRRRLTEALPGMDAHREMLPDYPQAEDRLQAAIDGRGELPGVKRSAVLVPLLTSAHALPDVLFTLRSETLRSHRGQISFPGGRIDEGEDVEGAALREMHEETGIEPHDVLVLGRLSDIFIPPSNSFVTPVVALVRRPSQYYISEAEVNEIFDVPLMRFMDAATKQYMKRTIFDDEVDVPYWHVHSTVPLWGATAMMLNELLWLTREYLEHHERR